MLLRICSDIHAEFWNTRDPLKIKRILNNMILPELPEDKETILIIAGDLCIGHLEIVWINILEVLSKQFKEVLWVAGNHFYYHNNYFGNVNSVRTELTLPYNTYFLEDANIVLDGVNFIGATLWTDFNRSDPLKMLAAQRGMSDFHIISKIGGGILTPQDTVEVFDNSKSFIEKSIEDNSGRVNVVITHHSPSFQSVPSKYRGSDINYAYCSNMESEIMDWQPELWIHGHTHDNFDYLIDKTRIVCNPYGYKDYQENRGYNSKLVIEV